MRTDEASFFQDWVGIEISRGSPVGFIQIGPTVAKLSVENGFAIEIFNPKMPRRKPQ